MRLEIGACFADYSAPGFFQRRHRRSTPGKAKLTKDGRPGRTTVAGLPVLARPSRARTMPKIRSQMGLELRDALPGRGLLGEVPHHRHGGPPGPAPNPSSASSSGLQVSFRADRPDRGLQARRAPGTSTGSPAACCSSPSTRVEYAWRQYRSVDHMHRARSLATTSTPTCRTSGACGGFRPRASRGFYMPSFSVGVVKPTALVSWHGGCGFDGAGRRRWPPARMLRHERLHDHDQAERLRGAGDAAAPVRDGA